MASTKRNGGGVIDYRHPDGDTTHKMKYRGSLGRQV
jgi:hypothetical protein